MPREVLLLPNAELIVTSAAPEKDDEGFWVVKLGPVGKPSDRPPHSLILARRLA